MGNTPGDDPITQKTNKTSNTFLLIFHQKNLLTFTAIHKIFPLHINILKSTSLTSKIIGNTYT